MEINETSTGLLFIDSPTSKWLLLAAVFFLLFLAPIIKYGSAQVKAYTGWTRIAAAFFYLSLACLFVVCASLCYLTPQYNKDYCVAINYKQAAPNILVSSGKKGQSYSNQLIDFKAFHLNKTHNSNKNSRSYRYNLSLVRKDNLMIKLGAYSEKEWQSVVPKLKEIALPIEESLPILYQKQAIAEKIDYPSTDLKSQISSANCVIDGDKLVLSWELKLNPILYKLGVALIGVVWFFLIFQTLAKHFSKSSFVFMYAVVLIFTLGFGYYFGNTFKATQQLILHSNGYNSCTNSFFWGKSACVSGKWKDAKIMLIEIDPSTNTGITISETENYSQDLSAILAQSFQNVVEGKYKYIRTDYLSVYDRLLLADYFFAQQQAGQIQKR